MAKGFSKMKNLKTLSLIFLTAILSGCTVIYGYGESNSESKDAPQSESIQSEPSQNSEAESNTSSSEATSQNNTETSSHTSSSSDSNVSSEEEVLPTSSSSENNSQTGSVTDSSHSETSENSSSGSSSSQSESTSESVSESLSETEAAHETQYVVVAEFTITKSNSGMGTTSLTTNRQVTYNTDAGNMVLEWSQGCYDHNKYDEFCITKNGGYLKTVSLPSGTRISTLEFDFYKAENATMYKGTDKNGEVLTGVKGTSTDNNDSLVMTYTIDGTDFYFYNSDENYAQSIYSLTIVLVAPATNQETSETSETSISETETEKETEVIVPPTNLEEYYANIKTSSGNALFDSLRTIINDGFKTLGYDGLLTAYATVDLRSDGYIQDIYSNATNYKPSDSGSNYKAEGDCYNREHTIPQSCWGKGTANQGCDIFIVYPTDGYVNNRRSSYAFGEVNNVTYASKNSFSKLGSSKLSGYSGTVFEPNDQWKGDLARAYFYAVTKWPNAYSWTKGTSGSVMFSGNASTNHGLTKYAVDLMLKWNKLDPVDEWERGRNDRAYGVQKNRNPYIDHPEWITAIWGS